MTGRTMPSKCLWDYGLVYESEFYALWHGETIEELSTMKEPAKTPITNEWLDFNSTIWCGDWIGPQRQTLKIIHIG
jgi:hypothetical protein